MNTPSPDGRPWVVVFRLQLFKPSETFIVAQAQALRRYRPLYVGWRRFGPGPGGAEVVQADSVVRRLALCLSGDPAAVLAHTGGRAPAVVHAHFGVDGVFAQALARRLGAPLVVTLHGFDVSRRRRSLLASLRPALIAYVFGWRGLRRRAALLIAVSAAVQAAALRRGAPAERVHVLATGVDLQTGETDAAPEPGLIVHVGRLVEKKGAHTLMQAFARLAAHHPQARLVIVGDGSRRGAVEALIRRLGLQRRVVLLGAQPHEAALAWMRRAAVVAVPSLIARNGDAEGLPSVALEAAALSRPLVASRIPALREAFEDGAEALLSPPGEVGSLAVALGRLLADPAGARRLGEAARRRVAADYDLARQTVRLEELYDAATGGDG